MVGLNLLAGEASAGIVHLASGGQVAVASDAEGATFVAIRPSSVTLHRSAPEGSARNVWSGEVGELYVVGDRVRVRVEGPVPLVVEVTAAAVAALDLGAGGRVWAASRRPTSRPTRADRAAGRRFLVRSTTVTVVTRTPRKVPLAGSRARRTRTGQSGHAPRVEAEDEMMEHIKVDGVRIGFERRGQGPPLVLLHGLPGDSRIWQRQLDDLAQDYTVVAWTRPDVAGRRTLPASSASARPPVPWLALRRSGSNRRT